MATATARRMTRKQKRLMVIGALGLVLAGIAALVLMALRDQIVFFYTPTEIAQKHVAPGQAIRLGGLVKEGSWVKDGQTNDFIVSDSAGGEMKARYIGILPDLFREGQGVVAEGSVEADGSFLASNVLAKHDENYVPKELAEELKARGEWRPGEPLPAGAGT